MVTMPPDPDDSIVADLQEEILNAMERNASQGLVLDISCVETVDSYFARTVTETARMVTLMGGRTIIAGMRPTVAVTATEIGLTLGDIETALSVDRAFDQITSPRQTCRSISRQ